MKHPIEAKNREQEEFLKNCLPEKRRLHELLFIIGNATFAYYEQARGLVPDQHDWEDYLKGLEEPIRGKLKAAGLEKLKDSLPFKRYLLESRDFGFNEYLEKHINVEDLKEYRELMKGYNEEL